MESRQKGTLLKILGVSFGVAVTVGGTIGVGILRTPGTVASLLGHPGLIILAWVLGGIYALLGTNAVLELGTMLPRTGGWYVFARRAFGDYVGFAVGWSDWVAESATIAILLIAIGEFSVDLFPALAGGAKPIAILTLLVFMILHWLGLRSSSRAQEWTSLIKALGFLVLIVCCFTGGRTHAGSTGTTVPIPRTFWSLAAAIIIALQSVIYTYDGWYSAVYFTEEDPNPRNNLPRSALSGVLITIVIYLLVNLALLYVLPMSRLASSTLPAAEAAQSVFGRYGSQVITTLSLISLLSIINATLMIGTRVFFAMSRDGLLWSKASSVSVSGTPRIAMGLTCLAAVLLVVSGTFTRLIAIAAFFFAAVDSTGFLALLTLRKREPGLDRPYRAWGFPWTTGIVLVGSTLFLLGNVISDAPNSLCALALIAISFPAYLLVTRRPRNRPVEQKSE
ncbi:MAG TPA: APC family permease [Acidobacteriota bacterium]|nr:APC family permease [Acidobacteriota bacterium]